MNSKFLVYEGQKFTIEWYFNSNNKSPAKEYYKELEEEQKDKIFHLIQMLGDIGKIFNKEKFRPEPNKIFAFKAFQDRLLCFFFENAKVIITNGFKKKKDGMPPRELEKAIRAREDYRVRCKQGNYYG